MNIYVSRWIYFYGDKGVRRRVHCAFINPPSNGDGRDDDDDGDVMIPGDGVLVREHVARVYTARIVRQKRVANKRASRINRLFSGRTKSSSIGKLDEPESAEYVSPVITSLCRHISTPLHLVLLSHILPLKDAAKRLMQ